MASKRTKAPRHARRWAMVPLIVGGLLPAMVPGTAAAQCDNYPNQHPPASGMLFPLANSGFAMIDACNRAGEFATVWVEAGDTYIFSTCADDGSNVTYDSQLTLRNFLSELLDHNNNWCGSQSRITWVADFTGIVQVHLNQWECASNEVCGRIMVSRTAAGSCAAVVPGCVLNDDAAYQTVTANDPFCCSNTWDVVCQGAFDAISTICTNAPANDECVNATPLTVGAAGSCPANAVEGDLSTATTNISITPSCLISGLVDVWYTFHSGDNTTIRWDIVPGTLGSYGIQVLDGCTGNEVFCQGDQLMGVFHVEPNTDYLLRLLALPAFAGTYTLCLEDGPEAPANDECLNAAPLTVGAAGSCPANAVEGDLLAATVSAGTTPSCLISDLTDVWYTFHSGENTTIRWDIVPGTLGSYGIQVLDGCTGNEVFCQGDQLMGVFFVEPDTDYLLRLLALPAFAGTYTLCLEDGPEAPANDECLNAAPLTVGAAGSCPANAVEGDLLAATVSAGTTPSCLISDLSDVWYTFHSGDNTTIRWDIVPGTLGSYGIQVLDGCTGNEVFCQANVLAGLVPVAPNTDYIFRLLTLPAFAGTYTLCLEDGPEVAANDECGSVTPQALAPGGAITYTGTTVGATHAGDGNFSAPAVWHAFTLSECATVTISYCGTFPAFTATNVAMTMECPAEVGIPGTLDSDLCGNGNNHITFDSLEAGTYYLPVAYVAGAADGPYSIEVSAEGCSDPACAVIPPDCVLSDVATYQYVIANDLSCCAVAWDEICQMIFDVVSTACTDPACAAVAPDCVLIDEVAYQEVIANDPFCCNEEWDEICQEVFDAFSTECTGGCATPPACVLNDEAAYQEVITNDPFCCNEEWDEICQEDFDAISTACTGGCITPPACVLGDDAAYQAVIVGDIFCCTISWDKSCQAEFDAISTACLTGPCAYDLVLELQTDDHASETSWAIIDDGTGAVVCSGSGYANNSIVTAACCVAEGCYRMEVYDSLGDGMGLGGGAWDIGGYVLRTGDGERIIDNAFNFADGGISTLAPGEGFCLPVGEDRPIHTSCDRFWWQSGNYLVAAGNPAVSAEFGVSNATSGYEFWFYDPNGGLSFRKFRNHATSDGFAPNNAMRAAHIKLNNWAAANHLQDNVLYNVRIRSVVDGMELPYGPACRVVLDPAQAACTPTGLNDIAGHPNFSCGVARTFGGPNSMANRVYARSVGGANKYEFEFSNPGEGYLVTVQSNTVIRHLNWSSQPALNVGSTYQVRVRASKDGGATWCNWGWACDVTIAPGAAPGGESFAALGQTGVSLWPNPNNGQQLWMAIDGLMDEVRSITVDIHDLSGKRVVAREVALLTGQAGARHGAMELDLGGIAAGTYVVTITAGEQRHVQRLVIVQ